MPYAVFIGIRPRFATRPLGHRRYRRLADSGANVCSTSKIFLWSTSFASIRRRPLALGGPLRSRRPVSARSLRCGLRLVPRLRLPYAPSLRPGGSGVGHRSFLAGPSVPDPPGGIQPPGFIMRRRPCRRRSGGHCAVGARTARRLSLRGRESIRGLRRHRAAAGGRYRDRSATADPNTTPVTFDRPERILYFTTAFSHRYSSSP